MSREKTTVAHCGAEPPANKQGIQIGRCYRPPAHTGDHAGFAETIDEVFFWGATSDPASAWAHLEAVRAARAEDQQRLLHYEGRIEEMQGHADELTRVGGELQQRAHALELEIAALKMDAAVPGAMKCDGCGLVVFTATISMERPDQIGIPIAPPQNEPCPNGCTRNDFPAEGGVRLVARELRPQTWKEADAATTAALLRTHDALEQLLKLSGHYAELLNMHDGGARLVFDHPGDWMRRLAELEGAGPEGIAPRSRGLLARVQAELEGHEVCRPPSGGLEAWRSAEIIGFHRGLHWIREILLGQPVPGTDPTAPAVVTRRQAGELADAIVMLGITAGIVDGRQPLDGPQLLHLADLVRAEFEDLKRHDTRKIGQ